MAGVATFGLREAHIPGSAGPDDVLWTHPDEAISGRRSTQALTRARRSLGESLRRRLVSKDVRMQMNLEGAHRRYGFPAVRLRRHPCDVVSSLRAATARHWTLDSKTLNRPDWRLVQVEGACWVGGRSSGPVSLDP